MNYVIYYDIVAVIISISILFSFIRKKTIFTRVTKAFFLLVGCICLSAIMDIITAYYIDNPQKLPLWALYFINELFFLPFTTIPFVFYYCIFLSINTIKISKKQADYLKLSSIPYIICMIAFLFSPWTKAMFYFTNDSESGKLIYLHGKLYFLLYIVAAFYLGSVFILSIKKRKKLSKQQLLVINFYTIASAVTAILQGVYPRTLIMCFVASITSMLIYLSLENPINYVDNEMGVYNKKAFSVFVQNSLTHDKPVNMVGLQIIGLKYLNETIGIENKQMLLRNLSTLLQTASGRKNVFRISSSKMVIILPNDKQKKAKIIERIKLVFEDTIHIEGFNIPLSLKMCTLSIPEDANTLVDTLDIITTSLKQMIDSESGTVLSADKSILEKKEREAKIVKILENALKNNEFYLVYQPIYSIEKQRYTTAEALLRLKSEELGYIGPDEFIPLAEQHGFILDIGEFVIRSVCEFIKREKIWEKGIEYIHVNLSAIQCMQENLYQQFIDIMDSYELDYKYLNFEVTETVAIASSDILKNNMNKLIEKSIKFSLDDYGTGFSNIYSLIRYPFHTIKIDKSIIWASMDDRRAMIILENIIKLAKSLNKEVVAEGVENIDQVNVLREMGCDYNQGYFYSKPILLEDFVNTLK